MTTYFIDANVYLRFFLQDNKKQAEEAKQYFIDAQSKKIKIVITPEMLVEVNYVLRVVYKISHQSVAEALLKMVQTPYFTIVDREILLSALHSYQNINVDIEDIILYVRAKQAHAEVFSFDEDIKKLQRAIG
ncbi:MAG: PilT protein domain protein [Parcubacteria group bacterium GW2011_GWA2_44_12]|nr:MAG: PilT protein domain protein [Parcubacteria group bacterium GW2011_GWA2_44_12]